MGSHTVLIFCLFGNVFAISCGLFGSDAASAIVTLAGVLTCDIEALALQYRMVHDPEAPKFTRCY
jgi:hypothetical protein